MLGKLLGGGKVVEQIGNIIDDVYTSEEEKLDKKIALERIQAKLKEKQIVLNTVEAKGNILQRSWRPLIGMSCALAIFWEFVAKQFIMFFIATFQIETHPLPELDMGTLMPLVMALLGMGALRSYEKKNNLTQ